MPYATLVVQQSMSTIQIGTTEESNVTSNVHPVGQHDDARSTIISPRLQTEEHARRSTHEIKLLLVAMGRRQVGTMVSRQSHEAISVERTTLALRGWRLRYGT
jgi:hypothetical protein